MGLKVVLIETKIFELLLEGGGCFIHIIERGRKVTRELILGLSTALWVAQSLEDCTRSNGDEFIRTSKLAVVPL